MSFEIQGTLLKKYTSKKKETSVVIPKGITHIASKAFYNCKNLQSVEFPEGLLEIGAQAFQGCSLTSVIVPRSVQKVYHEAFSGCKEIMVYDSINPDAEDCYAEFNDFNHEQHSELGFAGMSPAWAMWEWPGNHKEWYDYSIVVRSAETDQIKYIVEIAAAPKDRQYQHMLCSSWGRNATFAFKKQDKMFPKIEGSERKIRVALSRLQYGIDLDDETRSYYCKYLSRSAKAALEMCINDNRLEWIEVCAEIGVLKKDVLEYGIPLATKAKMTAITAYLLEYKNSHFPDAKKKADKEFDLLSLPKEKKPLDKNSVAYMKKIWKCEELEDGSLSLVKYAGEDTEIVIPDSIGGKVISTIGEMAFSPKQSRVLSSLKKVRASIVSVTFGDNIREIGKNAFDGCTELYAINWPNSTLVIKDSAFEGCISIEELSFSEGIIAIGKRAFAGCSALKKLTFATSIQKVEESAFEQCNQIEKINMAYCSAQIGKSAFKGCKLLTDVHNCENISIFEEGAFEHCSALRDISLSENTVIQNNVFFGCELFDQIIYGNKGTVIQFFPSSKAMGTLEIPEGIEKIGNNAFSGCDQLTSVQLPKSIKCIGAGAFAGCKKLEKVTILGKLEQIETEAFFGCIALKTLESPYDLNGVKCGAWVFIPNTPEFVLLKPKE